MHAANVIVKKWVLWNLFEGKDISPQQQLESGHLIH